MKTVLFLTSNEEKKKWAQKRLKQFDIRVKQKEFGLPEMQTVAIDNVVKGKAKYARDFIKAPFIVEDTGLDIPALDGFPGALLKPVMRTIGADGLCTLMNGKKDRRTNFKSVLAYVDAEGNINTFTCNDRGTLAKKPKGEQRAQWGEIMQIHQPDGFEQTLAEMSDETFATYEQKIEEEEHYVKFGHWLSTEVSK